MIFVTRGLSLLKTGAYSFLKMDTLFGCQRPEYVCQARIEIKLPAADGRLATVGRPLKIWEGPSDTEESLIHGLICEHRILSGMIRERKIAPDGHCTLQGRLTFLDKSQVIAKHDIEVVWVSLTSASHDNREGTEILIRIFDTYNRAMTEIRESHEKSLASISEHFTRSYSRMSKAFAAGMGKISEQSATIGTLANEIQKDREGLNAALLRVLSDPDRGVKRESTPTLETAIKGLTLLKDFGQRSDASGTSSQTNGHVSTDKPAASPGGSIKSSSAGPPELPASGSSEQVPTAAEPAPESTPSTAQSANPEQKV